MAQCVQHFIAIIGSTQVQFSIKYQKEKLVYFIKTDNRRPQRGPLCEGLP